MKNTIPYYFDPFLNSLFLSDLIFQTIVLAMSFKISPHPETHELSLWGGRGGGLRVGWCGTYFRVVFLSRWVEAPFSLSPFPYVIFWVCRNAKRGWQLTVTYKGRKTNNKAYGVTSAHFTFPDQIFFSNRFNYEATFFYGGGWGSSSRLDWVWVG